MQTQTQARTLTLDGYFENGCFQPAVTPPARLAGRFKAVLNVLDVPATETTEDTAHSERMKWLSELEHMIRTDDSPKLRIEDFPRLDFGREPIVWDDED